jgi:hypothetical protein
VFDRQLLETAPKTCRGCTLILTLNVTSPRSLVRLVPTPNLGVTCRIPRLWTLICCNTWDTLEWCSLLSRVKLPVERVAPFPRFIGSHPSLSRIPSHSGRTHHCASHQRCLPEADRQFAPRRPVEPHSITCGAIAITSDLGVRKLGANAARACRLGVSNRNRGIFTVCSQEHGDWSAGSASQEEKRRGEGKDTRHELDR